ncbi:MAG TPA: hypothetical protein VJA85_04060 [Candidatus Limnocylindria bacterium]|nr:hypothetical protein [Candidatus Limnocylindria bacterium]
MTTNARGSVHVIPPALLAMLLVACASSSPSPSVSPSPEPTPAATPLDVVVAFEAIVTSSEFAGTAAGRQEVTLGDSTATWSYDLSFAGTRVHSKAQLVVGDASRVIEVIQVNGVNYAKKDDGPWVVQTGEIRTMLPDLLRGLPPMVDRGVETLDGQALHHLVPANPATADLGALLGIATRASDVEATVDLYVTGAGAPVVMRVSAVFLQDTGGGPVGGHLSEEFSISLGPAPTIERPTDVWASHESARFPYAIAHPQAWAVEEDDIDTDRFRDSSRTVNFCNRIATVKYDPEPAVSGDAWFSEIARQLESAGGSVEETESIVVANADGRLFDSNLSVGDCGMAHLLLATFEESGRVWVVAVISPEGDEAHDRALLDGFLHTFEPREQPAVAEYGDTVALASLPVGACFDDAGDAFLQGTISAGDRHVLWFGARRAILADCAATHTYEVFATFPPSVSEVDCTESFEAYIGRAWADSSLGMVEVTPHDDERDAGSGSTCAVFVPGGGLFDPGVATTGSQKDSNR